MYRNAYLIQRELERVASRGFTVYLDPEYVYAIISGVSLPRVGVWTNRHGQQVYDNEFLFPFPGGYPNQFPGHGGSHPAYAIHAAPLFLNGEELQHVHDCNCQYGQAGWHWWCFTTLNWSHQRGDDILSLLFAVVASLEARKG